MKYMTLLLLFLVPAAPLQAQAVRDDFNRAATTDLAGSEKWRRVLDLTDPGASMQINADSTISPYNPLGPFQRGAVYWDSALSGRFQVGIILRHKSGGNNTPVFHIQLMNDSSWFTGDGYGLRFQENSTSDRFDIQRLTGSGADTPFVSLLANFNREFSEGDTLIFKFYPDGRKTAVCYSVNSTQDSISVVDTVHNPSGWYAWIRGTVFPDSVKLDNFLLGTIPYGILASAGPGGAISPSGSILVEPGADTSFTITPDPGFGIDDVLVDSVSVGTPSGYTFAGVTADHTIQAQFDTLRYTITASAGPNGTITPTGPVIVNYAASRSFSLSPDAGYHLDSLLVDGLPVDSTASYTFDNVTANHAIAAFFSIDVFTITATAGPDGSITPGGPVPVTYGADQAFTVAPAPGYHVDSVVVDGVKTDSAAGYTFFGVTSDHAISVTFSGPPSMNGTYPIRENWNIVSVPLTVSDFSKAALYPGAAGDAYAYSGGYFAYDTLSNGRAYWLKFPEDDSVSMTGSMRATDTVDVEDGWNMVGSISVPVPVTNVTSIPGGLVSSGFFGYGGSYELSPTIEPGRGYWVKIIGTGKLVLDDGPSASPVAGLRIIPTPEMPPPPPPGMPASSDRAGIPTAYALEQNYPNPFNPSTRIDFALPEDSYVRLTVYNILGEEVARLVDGIETAGRKSVNFDAAGLPTGLYTCRLSSGDFTRTIRMLILK